MKVNFGYGVKGLASVIIFLLLGSLLLSLGCFSSTTPPAPPWPDIKAYLDSSQTVAVKVNDEFVVGLDVRGDMFPIFKDTYDGDMVTLIDEEQIVYQTKDDSDCCVAWYLFKANKPGETQIIIQHFYHLLGSLQDQNLFNIVIE